MKIRNTSLFILFSLVFLQSCEEKIEADAYGNFEDDAQTISAESMGNLIAFNVEEGQLIKKGDLVAMVDTLQLHLSKQTILAGMSTIGSKANSVESQIAVYRESLNALKVDQNRISKMFKDGAATQKQMDDIEAAINLNNQKIVNIRTQSKSVLDEKSSFVAQIDQLNDLIRRNLILSPISGTVLETYAKKGEFTSMGKPLMSIQNVKSLTLRAYVSETQLASIQINQEVEVKVDVGEGGETFPGTITWISDKAEFTPKQIQTKDERKNLTYAIKIVVKNEEGVLKIGMPASVFFK